MPRPDIYDLADYVRAYNAAPPPEVRHTVPWLPSLAKHHPRGELTGQLLGMLAVFVNTLYEIDNEQMTLERATLVTRLPSEIVTGLFVLALELELLTHKGYASSETREVGDDEVRAAVLVATRKEHEAIDAGCRRPDYLLVRELPGGWKLFLEEQGYGQLRLGLGRGGGQLDNEWIFSDRVAGWRAALGWNGHGEPLGWFRHRPSGRRRPDGTPASEFIQW